MLFRSPVRKNIGALAAVGLPIGIALISEFLVLSAIALCINTRESQVGMVRDLSILRSAFIRRIAHIYLPNLFKIKNIDARGCVQLSVDNTVQNLNVEFASTAYNSIVKMSAIHFAVIIGSCDM